MSVTKTYKFNFTSDFLNDLKSWEKDSHREQGKQKIKVLLINMQSEPFKGLGKPELLKHNKGVWSRRITQEHRLTYTVEDNVIHLLTCRGHYN